MSSPDNVSGQAQAIREIYREYLRTHGATAAGVGWQQQPATHRLRFDRLATLIEPDTPFSVNDFGSGWGAFFLYLADRELDVERYVGFDLSAEMVEAARAAVTDSRAAFVEAATVTETADYSIVSGTFNVKCDADDDEWREYVLATLRALAEHSRRGLAFNMMSTYVDWRNDLLFYADPSFFFDFCKRELSTSVALLHDYPLWEWTMIVRL